MAPKPTVKTHIRLGARMRKELVRHQRAQNRPSLNNMINHALSEYINNNTQLLEAPARSS